MHTTYFLYDNALKLVIFELVSTFYGKYSVILNMKMFLK